jgi:hypothetical protein
MEAIGELVEPITTNLYAWRVPVAIVSIIAAFVVAAIAIRRGWFAAARRHPARATVLIVVGFVVVAPMAWYLGSPVFLRSSLVEAAPTAAPSGGVVAIDPTAPATPLTSEPAPSAAITSEPTAPPTPVPTPFEPVAVATGEFTGTDDFHFGRGTATVIEVGPGRYHLRLEDFSVRNGPDLFVYLSPDADGYHEDALELGRLKATDGSFGYDLPDGVDPAVFRSAIIWCKQFAHLFATAPFAPV